MASPGETDRSAGPDRSDTLRQGAVALSAVIGVAVAFLGSGAVVGTPVAEVADGALSAEATLVAPGGSAFSIWSVIYVGLLALAVLQLLPNRATDPRQRRTGWLVAASLLLNAAWILVVQAEWIAVSVVVIAVLLVVLVLTLVRLHGSRPASVVDAVLLDGTMGLYLGWICIATVANVAAALVHHDVEATGSTATAWAVTVLVIAGLVGVLLAVTLRGPVAPALALAWGLTWVAVARATDQPESGVASFVAASAAGITLASMLAMRLGAERRRRSG